MSLVTHAVSQKNTKDAPVGMTAKKKTTQKTDHKISDDKDSISQIYLSIANSYFLILYVKM